MPGAGVGLALVSKAHMGVAWASDLWARTLEDLQLALGEGPGWDAVQRARPTQEPSLGPSPARVSPAGASNRWPVFRPRAFDLGARAAFSYPLSVGGSCLGCIDVFRTEAGWLSREQRADALLLADVTAHALVDLHAMGGLDWESSDSSAEWTQVNQATGMVAAQMDADMATALACMRSYAFAYDLSIFAVADEVISRRLRLDAGVGIRPGGQVAG